MSEIYIHTKLSEVKPGTVIKVYPRGGVINSFETTVIGPHKTNDPDNQNIEVVITSVKMKNLNVYQRIGVLSSNTIVRVTK